MVYKQFKTFLRVIRHSIVPYDNFYGKILHKTKLAFSIKYFFALSILLVVLELASTFTGLTKTYPFVHVETGARAIIEQIPEDLVVHFEKGVLSTNYDRPIILFNPDITTPGTLLVIDQYAEDKKIYEYETRFLLTGKKFITRSEGRLMSFEYSGNNLASQSLSLNIGTLARSAANSIFGLYLLMILLCPIALTLLGLISLYITSIITFILCYRIIPGIRLSKVFQISLHAATAPLILKALLTLVGLSLPMSFWWFNAMIIVFLLAALYEAYILSSRPE